MNTVKIFISFLFIVFAFSCDTQTPCNFKLSDHVSFEDSSTYIQTDTFNVQLFDRLLIDSGSVSENQIRLWIESPEFSMTGDSVYEQSGQLLVLKQDHQNWQGKHFQYTVLLDGRKDNFTGIYPVIDIRYKYLAGGKVNCLDWNKTLMSILPREYNHYRDIEGYYLCADGTDILVELSSGGEKLVRRYPCWEVYAETIAEVQSLDQILRMLSEKFGFNIRRE